MKKFFIVTTRTCILCFSSFWLASCTAQPTKTAKQAVDVGYPHQISISKLADGLNPEFGFKIIGKIGGLHGSICWVGLENASIGILKIPDFRTPFVQRIDFNNENPLSVQNFQLTSFNTKVVSAVVYPIFAASRNSCYVRVRRSTGTVGSYQLYSLNLATRQGVIKEDELYMPQPLAIAPNGVSYAFAGALPYSNAYYRLIVNTDGQRKIVSRSRYSQDFSWSPTNTLLYSNLAAGANKKKNYNYPNIYENNLKGQVHQIAQSAFRPLMSPDRKHIAIYVTAADPKSPPSNPSDFYYDFNRVNRAKLAVLDVDSGQRTNVLTVHETYPDLFWSSDSKKLYAVENIYIFSKKTALCRISAYDVRTGKTKLICEMEQAGQATSYEDGKLLPYFTPLRIANDKYLLFHVPIHESGKYNYHVLAINLETGKRQDILAFSASISPYHKPLLDWIDAN